MSRRKQINRILTATSLYIQHHIPEMAHVPPLLHQLDGPPDSPRYAVTFETCVIDQCPHGFSTQTRAARQCPVLDCPLRRSVRLLLDRQGVVMHATQSGIHWS